MEKLCKKKNVGINNPVLYFIEHAKANICPISHYMNLVELRLGGQVFNYRTQHIIVYKD